MSQHSLKQHTQDPQFHHSKIVELVDEIFENNSVEEIIDHLNETSGGYIANPQIGGYTLASKHVSNTLCKNGQLVRFFLLLSKRHDHLISLNQEEVANA